MKKTGTLRARLCAILLSISIMMPSFWTTPVQAQYMTGNDLLRQCQSQEPLQVYRCMGYVAGVIDYHVMLQSLGTTPTTDFCLPKGVTAETAAVVVMNYLKKAPQNGDFIAAPAVTMALTEIYPCAAPKPKKRKK